MSTANGMNDQFTLRLLLPDYSGIPRYYRIEHEPTNKL